MKKESGKSVSRRAGLSTTLIFLTLFVLKVADIGVVGQWSWWWITVPLWGVAALVVILLALGFIVAVFSKGAKSKSMDLTVDAGPLGKGRLQRWVEQRQEKSKQ